MMNAVLRCEVTPPSRTNKNVPPELDAIVMRALARKRADRYASTLEFARALERDTPEYAFPWPLTWGLVALNFLPDRLARMFLRGFAFDVEPDQESPLSPPRS